MNNNSIGRDLKGKGKMVETSSARFADDDEDDTTHLTLGSSFTSLTVRTPQPPSPPSQLMQLPFSVKALSLGDNPPPQQQAAAAATDATFAGGSSSTITLSSANAPPQLQPLPQPRRFVLRPPKPELVPAVYRWATRRRATVHSLNYLLSHEIFIISGTVRCRKCQLSYEMEYDVRTELPTIREYVREMHHERRAPLDVVLPQCRFCGEANSARPVIADKKREINWLFLLLGRLLGCCTHAQLKYFCKHMGEHRIGVKNRLLYSTYVGLCWQLDQDDFF